MSQKVKLIFLFGLSRGSVRSLVWAFWLGPKFGLGRGWDQT